MLSESIAGVLFSPCQVIAEPCLDSVASTLLHGIELPSFCLAIGDCGLDNIAEPVFRKKDHAIGVRGNKIAGCDSMLANHCPAKDIWRPCVQTVGSGWERSQAEDRETDRAEFLAVAVESPDDETGYAHSLGLEQDDVADARFVKTSPIVDNEDIAWLRRFKTLKKNINASNVADRARTPPALHVRNERPHARRRKSDGNVRSQATVRQMWRREMVELIE